MVDLREYLRTHPCQGFHPKPFYSQAGDFFTYFLEDAPYFGKHHAPYLTVYHARDDERVVGFEVDGVKEFLQSGPGIFVGAMLRYNPDLAAEVIFPACLTDHQLLDAVTALMKEWHNRRHKKKLFEED